MVCQNHPKAVLADRLIVQSMNLLNWDVSVDILAANKSVIEKIHQTDQRNDVREHITHVAIGNCILNQRQNATTYYHHHKDT